jgi:hypothetical protein
LLDLAGPVPVDEQVHEQLAGERVAVGPGDGRLGQHLLERPRVPAGGGHPVDRVPQRPLVAGVFGAQLGDAAERAGPRPPAG